MRWFLRTGASLGAQVFKNCGWNTIRAYGFGGFNLEKGLADCSCGPLYGLQEITIRELPEALFCARSVFLFQE